MTQRELFRVLGAIATHVCKAYSGDLFYDLNAILSKFEKGEEIIILSRTTGSDLIDRYRKCLVESGVENPTDEESMRECERTLGWDLMTRISPEGELFFKWNDRSSYFFKYDFLCFTDHIYSPFTIL